MEMLLSSLQNLSLLMRRSPKPCYFDKLPDEIVLKIINLATGTNPFEPHNFLVDVISKISTRFKRLAADRSLWEGFVSIQGDTKMAKEVIQEFLCYRVTIFEISNTHNEKHIKVGPTLSAVEITKMTTRCPRMEYLILNDLRIESWPTSISPLLSLKALILRKVGTTCFVNVDLSSVAPNIEVFYLEGEGIGTNTMLPDMTNCERLREVMLSYGNFLYPRKIPFPRGLKELWRTMLPMSTRDSFSRAWLEDHFEDCRMVL